MSFDYLHARFDNPNIGRFLSIDPVRGNPKRPQSFNLFAYARNNPVNLKDPLGLMPVQPGQESSENDDENNNCDSEHDSDCPQEPVEPQPNPQEAGDEEDSGDDGTGNPTTTIILEVPIVEYHAVIWDEVVRITGGGSNRGVAFPNIDVDCEPCRTGQGWSVNLTITVKTFHVYYATNSDRPPEQVKSEEARHVDAYMGAVIAVAQAASPTSAAPCSVRRFSARSLTAGY